MFSKYYHDELSYFRESARAYAKQHPTTEWMLSEQDGDSGVERLAQGFSFLLARTRQRIEDEAPEAIHSLCELVLPNALSSVPSSTIVQFTPTISMLRGRKCIEAGSTLVSKPIFDVGVFGNGLTENSHRERVEILKSIKTQPARRFIDGDFKRGIAVEIEVDETGFRGAGDILIFGTILTELGASVMTWNSFCEIKLKYNSAQAELAWPPRAGSQPV